MKTIIVSDKDFDLHYLDSCLQASCDAKSTERWMEKFVCLHVDWGGSGWSRRVCEAKPISIFVLYSVEVYECRCCVVLLSEVVRSFEYRVSSISRAHVFTSNTFD